ncbi:MAG: hypothetical protein IPK08_07740 [Bacteroidetes bacterium]|nr:hypothetical protein [Bacteroidota bacterium]
MEIIRKQVFQDMGLLPEANKLMTRAWSNLMTTQPYASSAHLFDHAFSGLCLNPTKDSLIVCSGSRTDHGEVQVSGGMFPGYQEVPLTSAIFQLPVTATNLILQNDTAWLSASGYVLQEGLEMLLMFHTIKWKFIRS